MLQHLLMGWSSLGRGRSENRPVRSASVASTNASNGSMALAGTEINVAAFSVITAASGASAFTAMPSAYSSIAAPVVIRSSIAFVDPYKMCAPTCDDG